jgi:ornithine carbamoyltransferase
VEELAANAGVPVYNGLTEEWHPTQMLADFLTMHESSHRPYDALTYTYLGDARSNMGRSLLVMGAIMGADVRIYGPRQLWPPPDVQALASERAEQSGAEITVTHDRGKALLAPYRVNAEAMKETGNPRAKFMHCLPAFHDENTTVGREVIEHTGVKNGLEVTNEVFRSPGSIVFEQADNRLHTIKAILVATIGS